MKKQIPVKIFLQFLKYKGLIFKRSKGGHDMYDLPDDSLSRPIVIRNYLKEIPIDHVSANLQTLGVSKKEFESWMKENS